MSETAQAAPGQSVPRGGLPELDPLDRLVAALHALILCQENRSLIGMLAASRRDAAELADRLDNHEQQVIVRRNSPRNRTRPIRWRRLKLVRTSATDIQAALAHAAGGSGEPLSAGGPTGSVASAVLPQCSLR